MTIKETIINISKEEGLVTENINLKLGKDKFTDERLRIREAVISTTTKDGEETVTIIRTMKIKYL